MQQLWYRADLLRVRFLRYALNSIAGRIAALAVAVVFGGQGLQAQERRTPRLTIGVFDGPEALSFGYVRDVLLSPEGDVVVIDEMNPEVRLFNVDGRPIGDLGAVGRGPGEFVGAYAGGFDPRGQVHIVDVGNARISVFEFSDGRRAHISDQRLAERTYDVCLLGSRRYLLTPDGRALIDEIDAHGTIVRSFGEPVLPTGSLAREFGELPPTPLNWGHIVCDNGSNSILFLSRYTGTIRAYTPEGALRWSSRIRNFAQVDMRRPRSGAPCCVYYENARTGTIQRVEAAAANDNGVLWITLHEEEPGGRNQRYLSRAVRITDGIEIPVANPISAIAITGYWQDRPYGYTNLETPKVVVY